MESACPGKSFPLSLKFGSRNPRTPRALHAQPTTGHHRSADNGNHLAIAAAPSTPRHASSVRTFASNSVRFRGYSSTTPAYYILGLPESRVYPLGVILPSRIANQLWEYGTLIAARPHACALTRKFSPPTSVLQVPGFRPAASRKLLKSLVGASGFEPPASWSRTRPPRLTL
jgi:hypothetical protein